MTKAPCASALPVMVALGEKAPESKAAKELGNASGQAIDGAGAAGEAARQNGADRSCDGDRKR